MTMTPQTPPSTRARTSLARQAQARVERGAQHIARVLSVAGKAAPRQRDSRDVADLLSSTGIERARQGKRMGDYTSYLGAITIPNVYKAASVIVSNYASVPLRVLDDDDTDVDVRDRVPALHALLKAPNPQTRGRAFKQAECMDYLLTGNSICAYDDVDVAGRPHALFRLRPDRVLIAQTQVGSLAYGYLVQMGRDTETLWYDATEIQHVKWWNPQDPLWGLGAIEAGELGISKDRLINEFTFNYFDRGAIVDGVLSTPNQIPEVDRRAMMADWRAMRQGARAKFRTAMLWMGATYTPIASPLGDMPIVDLAKMGRNEVFELLGVPPQMVGDFDGTNYRNAQEANAFFWSETIAPILDQFDEDGYTPLVERYGPFHAAHEKREVIDLAMRAEAAQKLGSVPGFSVNQLYVAAGYDPLPDDDPVGQMIVMPKGSSLLTPEAVLARAEDTPAELEEGDDAGLLPPVPTATALPAAEGTGQGQPPEEGDAPPPPTTQPAGTGSGRKSAPPPRPAVSGPAPAGATSDTAPGARPTTRRQTYPDALLSPRARQAQRRPAGARETGRVSGGA